MLKRRVFTTSALADTAAAFVLHYAEYYDILPGIIIIYVSLKIEIARATNILCNAPPTNRLIPRSAFCVQMIHNKTDFVRSATIIIIPNIFFVIVMHG